jgi:hypothetical protein
MSIDAAIAKFVQERDERTIRQIVKSSFSGLEGEGGEQNAY